MSTTTKGNEKTDKSEQSAPKVQPDPSPAPGDKPSELPDEIPQWPVTGDGSGSGG